VTAARRNSSESLLIIARTLRAAALFGLEGRPFGRPSG
jgi:hypothetical protein